MAIDSGSGISAAATPSDAFVLETLHSFSGGGLDGAVPAGDLLSVGNTFYGVTTAGGSVGSGTVFSMASDGSNFHILHNFLGGASDGSSPLGGMVLVGNRLWGTTSSGGSAGAGTIFSIGLDGSNFTIEHSFTGSTGDNDVPIDGNSPAGSLALVGTKLYGTTMAGGASDAGSLYSIDTANLSNYQVLHSFIKPGTATTGFMNGNPIGGLITDGALLYGTTAGLSLIAHQTPIDVAADLGSVFSLDPGKGDNGFTELHHFNITDGTYPATHLTLSADHATLYGTTRDGNATGGGTVFALGTDGNNFKTLHTFSGGSTDGGGPMGSLLLSGTKLFGTTSRGSGANSGNIFSMDTNGANFQVKFTFPTMAFANSALVQGIVPGLGTVYYGMTQQGGSTNQGMVYMLETAPPVLHSPAVTNATTSVNTQTSSGLVITPNNGDSGVQFFQVTNIAGGTLFKHDGTTPIADGDFITVAEGFAGLRFTPDADSLAPGSFEVQEAISNSAAGLGGTTTTATITVTPLLSAPSVTSATTVENVQSSGGLVIMPDPVDAALAASFQITGITGGTLYQHDGVTPIANGSFITLAQGAAGLRFTPAANSLAGGSFVVKEASANPFALGAAATGTITVTPADDAPSVTPAKTIENTQTTSGLVIRPNAANPVGVTNFQITNITGGSLFLNDGTTPVAAGSFITLAQGAAGLKFTPAANSLSAGSFTVQQSTSGDASGLRGLTTTAAINVVSPWQNPARALDVNNDGFVSPVDALVIINRLNSATPTLPSLGGGQGPPPYYDAHSDGFLSALDALVVINRLNLEQGGPKIQVGLVNDTAANGQINNDKITSDPTLNGSVTSVAGLASLTSFTAALDNNSATLDLLGSLGSEGGFLITPQQLNQLAGGNLADGAHTLHLKAQDDVRFATIVNFTFTLQRTAPTPGMPTLDPASDGGTLGDDLTNVTSPGFDVAAQAGSTITLYVDGRAVASGPSGQPVVAPQLADGFHQVQASIVDASGNASGLSAPRTIQIASTLPVVNLSTLELTEDLTPNFAVTASSPLSLPNGTQFHIDVDLNNDGVFQPGELDNTIGTLVNGQQQGQLAVALPSATTDLGYIVGIRARVVDAAGNVGLSPVQRVLVNNQPTPFGSTLKNYVTANDGAYSFSQTDQIAGNGYTAYIVNMISQKWLTPADFAAGSAGNLWQHYLTIIVPNGPVSKTAMLFIDGGSVNDPPPTTNDFANGSLLDTMAQEAVLTHSVMVHLPNVPNEPIAFANDPAGATRSEDSIIAYSDSQFLASPDPNSDWPLLLPMVKSAVKAMDTVQTFVPSKISSDHIDHFVVSGASKRGWTTWLTAAVDNRVVGIVPMVFDALNLGAQMVHHYGVYGYFSPAIQPYQDEHIFDQVLTPSGAELGKIVDPYSYLNNGNFNIPKLGINSAGDQFFLPDSAQYYFHDLPGTQNYLLYLPNTDHGLDIGQGATSETAEALITFYNAIINNFPLPKFSWQILDDGSIKVQTGTQPLAVKLWQATNPAARDFRKDFVDTSVVNYTSSTLTNQGNGIYLASVPTPATGATAYFVEVDFPSPLPFPYRFTTEIHVATNQPLYPWPFNSGPPLPGPDLPLPTANGVARAASSAVAMAAAEASTSALAPAAFASAALDSTVGSQVAAHWAMPTVASTPAAPIQTLGSPAPTSSGAATSSGNEETSDGARWNENDAAVDDAHESSPADDADELSAREALVDSVMEHSLDDVLAALFG